MIGCCLVDADRVSPRYTALVPFAIGTSLGTTVINGVTLGIANATVFGIGVQCGGGQVEATYILPASYAGQTVYVQAFQTQPVRLASNVLPVTVATGGPVLQERKTKNANCVDLDAATITILRAHHEHAVERAVDNGLVVGLCPLFAQRHDASKSWKPNWVTKRFAVALDTAGVAHFRLHDLRHFVATQMLAAGIGLPVVAARLGHARVSTTLNVYAASMPAWDRAAAETLSTLLRAS